VADTVEYLPGIYQQFRERFPAVAGAQDALAREVAAAAPFDARTVRLLKLALAVGSESEGAVRSNARKALSLGANADELRAVAVLAVTTCGFPTAVAGLGWIEDVVAAEVGRG
jgi:alkylhydroperoxidase/carboxymuconolactone decarboxylase family protein YurZ